MDSITNKTDEVSDLYKLKGRPHENREKFPQLIPKIKHAIQDVRTVDP